MFWIKHKMFLGKLAFLLITVFIILSLSGWTAISHTSNLDQPPLAPPSGEGDESEEDESTEPAEAEPVDVIVNGDFEKEWTSLDGVAPDWTPFTNGEAFIGWYDEQWPEAVRSGEHAQLMEIDDVFGNILDRVIAVYQTVEVAPNSEYELTIHAILRSDAPEPLRNKFEYEMNWGIDPFGEENYDNVDEWVYMDLTEQLRIGSNGEFPDDKPLVYERITGTVKTGDTDKITLFIRGLKKFPNGTEVNFDIDDVSLVGPAPGASPPTDDGPDVIIVPEESDDNLPQTGATLSLNGAVAGKFALGAFVLILLGTAAAVGVLFQQKKM